MIDVRDVIDINSSDIRWFRIPGFPGYEITYINNKAIALRSFKQRHQHPFGNIVIPSKKGFYTITNSNNQKVKIHSTELYDLADKSVSYLTSEVQNTSRNPRCGINPDDLTPYGKVVQKPKPINNEQISFADFSNIPDIPLN